jgi:hypothetical protein
VISAPVPKSSLVFVCGDALKARELLSDTFRRSKSRGKDRMDDRREGSDGSDVVERTEGMIMEERQVVNLLELRRFVDGGGKGSKHIIVLL